jgi:phospholipase/carboxylesterase
MTTSTSLTFIHRFEPGADPRTHPLLLLHGTGGDENDLVALGREVAPGASLLSPRGKVLENGMPRFFRRLAEGVFDETDVRHRADELADFVAEARETYGLPAPIALGYSNGANIAAAILLLRPEALDGAVLLRPMMPLSSPPVPELGGKPVLLVSGLGDPFAPGGSAETLKDALSRGGAKVEHRVLPGGHALTRDDLDVAHRWLEAHRPG